MGLRAKKASILFALLLLLFIGISLFYEFPDTASAPYHSPVDRNTEDGSVVKPSSNPVATTRPPAVPVTPAPPTAPVTQQDEDYLTVYMDRSDALRGSLILINNDHRYDVPRENDFISIARVKTSSYLVIDESLTVDPLIVEPLNSMMDAFFAETDYETVTIISAYRDYDKQLDVLIEYSTNMGSEEAQRWVAWPGHSEHHSGLAVDFGVFRGGRMRTFTGTGMFSWFSENSYKYGFILRYTEEKSDITGVAGEPWHFRYVGNPHAFIMKENNWCLEEYIEIVTWHSFDNPLEITYLGELYHVYFSSGTEVRIPFNCEFDISGSNIGGFIVTVRY